MSDSRIVHILAPSRSFSAGPGCRTLVMALVGASHPRQIEEQARKIRTLAAKGAPGNEYEALYSKFLEAQSRAWRSGAPLEALIEKVILEH